MSATYTDLSVTSTATINNVNATTINSTTLTASDSTITNLITDTIVSGSSGTVNIGDSNDLINIEGSTINIGITGGTVNLLGTTTYIDTTNTNIKDNLITLNSGGWDATCIGSGIEHSGSLGVIKASLKLDNNLDYIISSTNNKLTVDNLSTTNITGVSSISSTSATLNTLVVNGYAQLKGDVLLGDSAVDTLTVNATANFENSMDCNGITNTGTITTTNVVATGLAGALTTASQTAITSVGTLTSLTVSGNLTVDTNTLRVDSTNNRVGINKTTPAVPLDVVGNTVITGNLTVSANIGGTNISGTLTTAAQPNITSVGNLTSLQNTTGTAQFGTTGTNLYIDNTTNKIGFGTGSTLTAAEKVEIIGGLKVDSLNLSSFTPSTLNTTTLNVSGVSTLSGNTTVGTTSADTLQVNSTPTFSQLCLLNGGADILPRYDSGWFAVSINTSYTLTLPFTVNFARPPQFQIIFSTTSTGIIGNGTGTTQFVGDITSQGVNSGYNQSYAIRYSSSSSVILRTATTAVALGFNGATGLLYNTGYYRVYAR